MAVFFSKSALRKAKRKLRRLINRRIFAMFMAHKVMRAQADLRAQQQDDALSALKGESSARRLGLPGKRRGLGRARERQKPGRTRTRDRDEGVKKSAKEEQLWQLKSNAMREKARNRKKEAMDRWQMLNTSGGSFRGR
ncbi:hypothetical protein GC177_07990 [bacterium]|nr:hypothetical protein [bacterium]